jgi:cytochrome P450
MARIGQCDEFIHKFWLWVCISKNKTGLLMDFAYKREHSRAMLRPQFTREQVADLEQEEIHVQHMFQHLQSDGSGWTSEVDLGPLFFRLTIDTATGFLFGQSVNSQLSSLPGQKDTASTSNELDWASFADHFDDGMAALGARGRLFNLYWLHNPRSFRDDCAGINRFADHFVQMALERDKNGIENPESSSREKQRYVFLQELVKVTKDPVVLRSQLLHVLLAGRDTTAGLLGWLCWNLARNPVVFQKLRETVLDTFGSYQNPREITFARLKSCSYLQYTLHESLRLFPSVPLNSRRATKDTSLPYGGGPDGQSPIFVRKGEEVNYSVYAMHRRKDLWGPDADVFNPDRWYNRKSTWEYLPFNGGPRICLGQQFALTEAGYVLTRLVQRFDRIESCDPISEIRHQYAVTSAPRRVLVRLHETKENPTK